jgi:Arylsulfotransferase (ASST)
LPEPEFIALDVYLNPNSFLSAVAKIKPNVDVTAYLEYGPDENLGQSTPAIDILAGEKETVYALGLEPDRQYFFRPWIVDKLGRSLPGAVTSVITGPWPDYYPLPKVTDYTDGSNWTDEEVICVPQAFEELRMFMCLNRQGNPVWYFITPLETGVLNFTPLSRDGLIATAGSELVIFNTAGEIIKKFPSSRLEDQTKYNHWFFHHDLIEITEGPWKGAIALITSSSDRVTFQPLETSVDTTDNEYYNYSLTAITEPVTYTVKADGIIVLDWENEEVLWDFSLHGEMRDNRTIDQESLPYTRFGLQGLSLTADNEIDFSHANSILHGIDEDGQFFWMSLRNHDWIVKIDVETEKIVWRMGHKGDFQLVDSLDSTSPTAVTDEHWMYHQHSPEWQSHGDGLYEFLIFDNGSQRPRPADNRYAGNEYSRAVLFTIDENDMLAEVSYSYGDSDRESNDYFYSRLNSDVDMMPGGGGFLLTSGNAPDQHNFCAQFSYPVSIILWELNSLGPNGFGGAIYRSKYFPDIYDTSWWYRVDR